MGASASLSPSESPSVSPSLSPSGSPSESPSRSPSVSASLSPSVSPSLSPSTSVSPSGSPSRSPSRSPSASPSASPSQEAYGVISPTTSNTWKGVFIIKWEGLNVSGATGIPFACPNYPIKSVHVVGVWGGSSATVVIEGSNMIDSPTHVGLTSDGTNAISFTANGLKKIFENSYWVRPRLTSGADVNTSIDVYLVAHTER